MKTLKRKQQLFCIHITVTQQKHNINNNHNTKQEQQLEASIVFIMHDIVIYQKIYLEYLKTYYFYDFLCLRHHQHEFFHDL